MRLWAILAVAVAAHAATPTFNKDIAPILYQNCATCHRPGEVAPFSLLTYADAAKKAGLLAIVTGKRVMPPWKAEPGYGSFANERRLVPGGAFGCASLRPFANECDLLFGKAPFVGEGAVAGLGFPWRHDALFCDGGELAGSLRGIRV